jgi:hypothetical protein
MADGKTSGHGDLKRVSRVAGGLPWVAVLAIWLCGLYVRLRFGRWPRIYVDSPEFLFSDGAAIVAALAALSWPAMVAVAVLLPLVRASFHARPVFNRWVVSAGTGTLVLWLLWKLDPYGFLAWAFD